MTNAKRLIAMFDSGLGGLTVLSALRRTVPDADVIYAADTARVPYGDRPLEEVAGFARQIIAHLAHDDPALLVIACGTSCSAFDRFGYEPRSLQTLPIVDCGVRAAVATTKNGRIGVIATAATIKSGVFERKIKRALPSAHVTSVGAPRLVPLIESGAWGAEEARRAVEEYCLPFTRERCDTVVLGCTHFPHLLTWFEPALGPGVKIVDPAEQCAREAIPLLEAFAAGAGIVRFEVSGSVEQFVHCAHELAGVTLAQVQRVDFSDQVKHPEYH